MMKKTLFIPFILFILLALFFAKQLKLNQGGDDPTKLESVLIGKEVPSFRLEDLNQADKIYDQSVFKGEPMLFNVWATWCPTCYAEHHYLNELKENGVKIMGLNYKDDRAKAIKWLEELGNPYLHTFYDGNGMLGLDMGVYGAPETFLIDKDGIIRYRHVGDVNERNWEQTLKPMYDQLLAEAN
ncbi:thiol:disulfide interchange protein [Vibrio sp. 10N.286.49.B3]|uniref:DsbE family thiol:disulfide interchange protein n=1 Tax=Vibrio sp. 10N.286.49.B3 TaxID=1880855 RepID=UPI000C838354|nr:DsbE family thiol:disulfide interchange protein [Vibrio sp. 10N.286.49.B3]PMH41010.1 thiol:disulfide interchange protein [Vibrio sp. 10N.286.49.B3]